MTGISASEIVLIRSDGNTAGLAALVRKKLSSLAGGGVMGTVLGVVMAKILVKVLTGVFDPPPEHLFIPWGYLAILAAAAIVSTIIAVLGMKMISRRPVVEALRNL